MKRAKRITDVWTLAVVATVLVGMMIGSAHAETIYLDDFSGGAGDPLHGTTPDITTGGATWTAGSLCKADGSFAKPDAMTLPFVPVAGLVYTLDCSISSMPSGTWNKFGFNHTLFWHGAYLLRASTDLGAEHRVYGGGGNWTALASQDWPMDVRIVLDTTGGLGSSTFSYYAKPSGVGTYTEVLSSASGVNVSGITTIGFGANNCPGQITSITLSDNTLPAVPTVEVSDNTVASNAPPGTVVGTLSDPSGAGDEFQMAAGAGDTDNAKFEITDGTNLRTRVWMSQYSNSVSIAALSNSTALVTNSLPILVTAGGDPIFQVSAEVANPIVDGDIVGLMQAANEDATFTFVGGRDDLFTQDASGNLLVTNAASWGALGSTNYVTLRATTSGGSDDLVVGVEVVNTTPAGTIFLFN